MGSSESKTTENKIINVQAENLLNLHEAKKEILTSVESYLQNILILLIILTVILIIILIVKICKNIKNDFFKKINKEVIKATIDIV